jgi:hypothetical protein
MKKAKIIEIIFAIIGGVAILAVIAYLFFFLIFKTEL